MFDCGFEVKTPSTTKLRYHSSTSCHKTIMMRSRLSKSRTTPDQEETRDDAIGLATSNTTTSSRRRQVVTFCTDVHVVALGMEVGDHPSCSSGCPLRLGDEVIDMYTVPLKGAASDDDDVGESRNDDSRDHISGAHHSQNDRRSDSEIEELIRAGHFSAITSSPSKKFPSPFYPRQRKKYSALDAGTRKEILLRAGYSLTDIALAAQRVIEAQVHRLESQHDNSYREGRNHPKMLIQKFNQSKNTLKQKIHRVLLGKEQSLYRSNSNTSENGDNHASRTKWR